MAVQAKILRVMRLISMLQRRPRAISELAETLDTSTRSVYRYIILLEELSMVIDKDFHNRYFIHTQSDEEGQINFTAEESTMINELVQTVAGQHPLKDSVLKKLFIHSDLKQVSGELVKARLGKMVHDLVEANKVKQRVLLKNYHSAHSGEIRDRLVEPVGFNQAYDILIAYEVQDRMNKSFKLERISEVLPLNMPFEFEDQHKLPEQDIFGVSGGETETVTLKLTLRAYLLLREEYPLALPYLSREDNTYLFRGPVHGYAGVGRFVMGLPGEVEVAPIGIGGEGLKRYVVEQRALARPS